VVAVLVNQQVVEVHPEATLLLVQSHQLAAVAVVLTVAWLTLADDQEVQVVAAVTLVRMEVRAALVLLDKEILAVVMVVPTHQLLQQVVVKVLPVVEQEATLVEEEVVRERKCLGFLILMVRQRVVDGGLQDTVMHLQEDTLQVVAAEAAPPLHQLVLLMDRITAASVAAAAEVSPSTAV
jgi:hypothetical protein